MKGPRVADTAWVFGGQAATALGTLVGVRILTEQLTPTLFGMVTLLLGAVALCLSIAVNPLTQCALHLYPEFVANKDLPALTNALWRGLTRLARWTVPVLTAAIAWLMIGQGLPAWSVLIVLALVALDAWRLLCLAFLSAAQQHRRYALWVAIDAWLRPILAVAAVLLIGAHTVPVVAAYALASLLLLAVFRSDAAAVSPSASRPDTMLDARVWRYALPLVPLGLIGWANGLGDRYLIGGLLTLADAGLYAAAYGLASRPILMLAGAIELLMRPPYQSAVSARDSAAARRLQRRWLGALLVSGTVLVVLLDALAAPLAHWLLGEAYRASATALIPWIAAGHLLQAVGQVFQRICYAHGDTRAVLWIMSAAACAGLAAIPLGIGFAGLVGAAIAVPVYFGVEMLVAMWFAVRSRRQALPPTGASPA